MLTARFIKVIDTDGNMWILNLDQIISIKGIQSTSYIDPNMESDNPSKKERLSIKTSSDVIYVDYPGGLDAFLIDTAICTVSIDASFNL